MHVIAHGTAQHSTSGHIDKFTFAMHWLSIGILLCLASVCMSLYIPLVLEVGLCGSHTKGVREWALHVRVATMISLGLGLVEEDRPSKFPYDVILWCSNIIVPVTD